MTDNLGSATIPRPMVPGAEIQALRRFHRDGTWEGIIHAGGMGPGTPSQRAVGSARHHWIQDGSWVVGDYEQSQMLDDGTFVLKWELHWVCGWDPLAGEYKATITDNYGRADVLRGEIEGDLMTFRSMPDRMPMIRLTWQVLESGSILWRNEMSLDGVEWMPVEDYEIRTSD